MKELMIEEVSKGVSNFFYDNNIKATGELMELFDKITKTPLKNANDYIKMYDDNFYTYKTFEKLIISEEEQTDGLTKEECLSELNISIWKLPCGWYVQYV